MIERVGNKSVDRVSGLTPTQFKTRYMDSRLPVILPLSEYLDITPFPDQKSTVACLGHYPVHAIEDYVTLFQRTQHLRQNPKSCSVEDYLNTIKADPHTSLRVLEEPAPEPLLEKTGTPSLVECRPESKVSSQLFITPRGHTSPMHFDGDHNHILLAQLMGRKQIFIAPVYSAIKLMPVLHQSWLQFQNMPERLLDEYVEASEGWIITLEPGDMLYLPMMIWHQVTSLDNSLSLHFRFGCTSENAFLARAVHSDSYLQNLATLVDSDVGYHKKMGKMIMSCIRDDLQHPGNSPFATYLMMREKLQGLCQQYCPKMDTTPYQLIYEEQLVESHSPMKDFAERPYMDA